jgi:hypothetical protein
MFAIIARAHSLRTMLSFIGSEGVDGGQGNADYIFGLSPSPFRTPPVLDQTHIFLASVLKPTP